MFRSRLISPFGIYGTHALDISMYDYDVNHVFIISIYFILCYYVSK